MRLSHSLRVLSQSAPKCNHNVSSLILNNFFESLCKINYIENALWLLKKSLVGTLWLHFGGLCERTLNEWLSLMVDACTWNCERTQGFHSQVATGCLGDYFQQVISMYSLITLWSNWWVLFERTQNVSAGYFVDTLLKKSQWNHNVSAE